MVKNALQTTESDHSPYEALFEVKKKWVTGRKTHSLRVPNIKETFGIFVTPINALGEG